MQNSAAAAPFLSNASYSHFGAGHCCSKSLSTAPPLASADTGTGVKVGRASEMGFMSRCPVEAEGPGAPSRGTAAERGARKGLDSPGRFPGRAPVAGPAAAPLAFL